MQHDYLHSYRALGIAPGAGWADVKAAYRTKVRAWHPDRFAGNDEQKQFAEEQTKTINKAYRQLADFHRKHGVLPLMTAWAASAPQTSQGAPEFRTPYRSPGAKQRRFVVVNPLVTRAAIAIVVLLAAFLAIYTTVPLEQSGVTEPMPVAERPSTQTDTHPTKVAAPAAYFTIGSTLGEVYAAQGIPSHTDGDIWHYGTSKIYFSRGKVVHWDETREHPLRVQLNTPSTPHQEPNYFTRGSTKADVRRVQGMPLRETDSVWDYGVSRVYFENDRVVGWNESSLNPLKTH